MTTAPQSLNGSMALRLYDLNSALPPSIFTCLTHHSANHLMLCHTFICRRPSIPLQIAAKRQAHSDHRWTLKVPFGYNRQSLRRRVSASFSDFLYISLFFQIFFHFGISQDSSTSSLCVPSFSPPQCHLIFPIFAPIAP